MRTIITALTMVASKLTIVAGLLLLMFYIMSVIFTDLFKGMYDDGLLSEGKSNERIRFVIVLALKYISLFLRTIKLIKITLEALDRLPSPSFKS